VFSRRDTPGAAHRSRTGGSHGAQTFPIGDGDGGCPARHGTGGCCGTRGDARGCDICRHNGIAELRVRITDTAYEGLPAETPAGRYLLTLEVEATEGAGLNFMQLPEGMSTDDFMTMLAGPPAASSEAAMGTPMAEAGPPEGEGEDGAPEWYFQTAIAGGTGAFAGTAQAIIDLTPGEWIAWSGYPDAPQAPVGLSVTGEAGATPAAGAEP
jgi:hypothetical protein